jgi:predicted lipoprotein with Yx(FWY)xxD motif
MKTSTIVSTIAILVVAAGAWYYLSNANMTPATQDQAQAPAGPSGAAGLNDSANQGNLGQPDTGVVQQPMADGAEGSIIGANLALGVDGAVGKTHLIAYNGMTLYTKDGDSATASTCYGACATNWPPYIVGAEDNVHNVKAGVNGKVDSIVRTDGKAQVTYNGKPLYFWKSDVKSGDTTGDNVGGVWHVVKP